MQIKKNSEALDKLTLYAKSIMDMQKGAQRSIRILLKACGFRFQNEKCKTVTRSSFRLAIPMEKKIRVFYPCDKCDKAYTTKEALKGHMEFGECKVMLIWIHRKAFLFKKGLALHIA